MQQRVRQGRSPSQEQPLNQSDSLWNRATLCRCHAGEQLKDLEPDAALATEQGALAAEAADSDMWALVDLVLYEATGDDELDGQHHEALSKCPPAWQVRSLLP